MSLVGWRRCPENPPITLVDAVEVAAADVEAPWEAETIASMVVAPLMTAMAEAAATAAVAHTVAAATLEAMVAVVEEATTRTVGFRMRPASLWQCSTALLFKTHFYFSCFRDFFFQNDTYSLYPSCAFLVHASDFFFFFGVLIGRSTLSMFFLNISPLAYICLFFHLFFYSRCILLLSVISLIPMCILNCFHGRRWADV